MVSDNFFYGIIHFFFILDSSSGVVRPLWNSDAGFRCNIKYCSECEPEVDWITCQYCDNIKICSRDCAHDSYKLDICEGEGCNRANCTSCFANHDSVEYVTQCTGFDGSDYGHNEGCYTQFCTDCRMKKLETMKWRAECCRLCVGSVGPALVRAKEELYAENERLREEIEKLRVE